MTERILSPQLLKLVQAAGPGYSLADPEWVKKFAELIVRECAKQCDPETGMKYSPNAASSRQDCKEKILQLLN